MDATVHVRAPAKLNLFLHVTGRRDDGYHELDSLFIPLALADALQITINASAERERNSVSCVVPACPELDGSDNLATRAAAQYLTQAGLVGIEVSVLIDKRIWVAAGLGGGSSDAAAVLMTLEQHFGALGKDALKALALQLGADVPFFLLGSAARAKGVGEILEPIDASALPRLQLVLANPGVALPTREVFGQLKRDQIGPKKVSLPAELPNPDALLPLVSNDLLAPAATLCPQITEIIALFDTARGVGMTGSGPTVFGIFATEAEADEAASRIQQSTQQPGIQTIVTHTASG